MERSLHETIILKVCMFLQQFFSLMWKFLVETNRGFKIRLRHAFRHYNLLAISNAKWFFLGTETDNVFFQVEEREKKTNANTSWENLPNKNQPFGKYYDEPICTARQHV